MKKGIGEEEGQQEDGQASNPGRSQSRDVPLRHGKQNLGLERLRAGHRRPMFLPFILLDKAPFPRFTRRISQVRERYGTQTTQDPTLLETK